MYCSKCGRQIPEGGSFCPHCGTPVGGNTEGGNGTLAEEIGKTVDLSEPVKPAPPGRFQLTRDRGKLCVLVSAAVAVAAVVMLLFAFRSPAATLKRQMDIGSRYLKEGNFEQAVMAYRKALDIDPTAGEAYIGLAKAYAGSKDHENEILILRDGIEKAADKDDRTTLQTMMTDSLDHLVAEAKDLFRSGNTDGAKTVYELVLLADPERGEVYSSLADIDEACSNIQQAVTDLNCGITALQNNDDTESKQWVEKFEDRIAGYEDTQETEESKSPPEAEEETTTEDQAEEASYLIPGPDFNNALFSVIDYDENITDTNGTDTNGMVKAITRSDTAPAETENVKDVSESGDPTYVWYEDGHIYWYSEAPTVYLNPDSSNMFFRQYSCTSIDLTGMDTSYVINMDHMFAATSLRTLDLSNFDTSHVSNMYYMFCATPLDSLDLSGFDMSSMPETDPNDLENSPLCGMLAGIWHADTNTYESADDVVTWWPGVTDIEKQAATHDFMSEEEEAGTTENTEGTAVDGSSVVQNADGTYQIEGDGIYSFGTLPYQNMSEAEEPYCITSYDLQDDTFSFTTNSICYYAGNQPYDEPAGTYVVPISSDFVFTYGGNIFADFVSDGNAMDDLRNALSQYGEEGVSIFAEIENGEIVQFNLEA